jgi:isopenicillin-N N-acyltransferase-like protein
VGIGVPVHVLARSILDEAHDLNQAMLRAAQAPVSASTSLTMVAVAGTESAAVSAELNPGGIGYALPDAEGLLVHTNHFLSTPANLHDTELRNGPDTVIRYDMLRRKLAGRDLTTGDALDALSSHLMAGGGTCCHIDPSLPAAGQFQTLATVVLDVANGTLAAHPGGACTASSTLKEKINA